MAGWEGACVSHCFPPITLYTLSYLSLLIVRTFLSSDVLLLLSSCFSLAVLLFTQDLEAAADTCHQKKEWSSAKRCFEQAAELYMRGGRHQTGEKGFCQVAGLEREREKADWVVALRQDNGVLAPFFADVIDVNRSPTFPSPLTHTGADCLAKGARGIEEHDPQQAMAWVQRAIDVYAAEGKGLQALDIYR